MSRRHARRGFVLLLIAVSAVVLFGFAGLAIDVGSLHLRRVRQQTAADAAALAATLERAAGRADQATAAARLAAQQHGFTHGSNGVTVTVNFPPSSGDYTTENSAGEVIVTASGPTYFMQALGVGSQLLRTRAVAKPGPDPNCVYALDPSENDGLKMSGSAAVNVSCGIFVNSSASKAVNLSGSACITASSVKVVGSVASSSSCPITPTATTGVTPITDPLASLTPPAYGGCDYTGYKLGGGADTISPGVYCKGIVVSGGGQLTMLPGTYIMVGTGLDMSGGSSKVVGNGVTVYNTFNGSYAFGGFTLSGGGDFQLKAPTSGPYAGILLFEDRAAPTAKPSTLSGGTSSWLEGAVYLRNNTLKLSGGSSVAAYTVLVADKFELSGSSSLGSDYSGLSSGPPLKNGVAMVE
ncbi:MAG: hypothetical protein JNN08_30960 [Bryobacterales bacterium]|nr:hypothetical protein [Bryobacterales bacterium]